MQTGVINFPSVLFQCIITSFDGIVRSLILALEHLLSDEFLAVNLYMRQCGINRFAPLVFEKLTNNYLLYFLEKSSIFGIFPDLGGVNRFRAGSIGSARQKQFRAANRFTPHIFRIPNSHFLMH